MSRLSLAVITSSHKLSDVKDRFIILQFCRLGVQQGPHRTEVKVSAGLPYLLGALGDDLFLCLLRLLEATYIPWLMSASSIFTTNSHK